MSKFSKTYLNKVTPIISKYLTRKTGVSWFFIMPETVTTDGISYSQLAFASDSGHGVSLLIKSNETITATAKVSIINYYKPGKTFDDIPSLTVKLDPQADSGLLKVLPIIPTIVAGKVKQGSNSIQMVEAEMSDELGDAAMYESLSEPTINYIDHELFASVAAKVYQDNLVINESALLSGYGQLGVTIAKKMVESCKTVDELHDKVWSGALYTLIESAVVENNTDPVSLLENSAVLDPKVQEIVDYVVEKTESGEGFTLTNVHHDLSITAYKIFSTFMKEHPEQFVKQKGKSFVKDVKSFPAYIESAFSTGATSAGSFIKATVTVGRAVRADMSSAGLPKGLDLESGVDDLERVSFEEQLEDLSITFNIFLKNKAMHLFLLGGIGGIGKCVDIETEF